MPFQTDQQLKDYLDWAYSSDDRGNLGADLPQFMAGGHDGLFRQYGGIDPATPYGGPVNVTIKKLHFYYFMIDSDGTISHREFAKKFQNPWPNDAPLLAQIATWIGGGDADDQNLNSDLDMLEWSEPCVVAFAVNLPTWKFFEDPAGTRSALQFPGGKSGGKTFHDNKTFHDARFGTAANHRVLLANNRHLLPSGTGSRPKTVPKHPEDDYKFDLYFRVDLKEANNQLGSLTITVDPGGKNLGP